MTPQRGTTARTHTSPSRTRTGVALAAALAMAASLSAAHGASSADDSVPASATTAADVLEVPAVLGGNQWLTHHRQDLMPYWDTPAALGEPVGNFPTWRGLDGEPLATDTRRGLVALARGVYGYSVAFLLTGEPRYLTYAKAGIDWINTRARDRVNGGWFGQLTQAGAPVDPDARKDVFDLASLGLAFGMYFNVTRDPAVEDDLLAVRDLLFERYYDPTTGRVKDAMTHDFSAEVDTGDNGGDITNYLVPGSALLLPNADLLTDPARRTQFRNDLRVVTEQLIARHKGTGADSWWFWGRTGRIGRFNSPQTDFGHSIKSHELILNANTMFPDRPWSNLEADLDTLLPRAWDAPVRRWNQQRLGPAGAGIERDSEWWIHNEADQTLAALNLRDGFADQDWLADSAQGWLDAFVDRTRAARETFLRPARDPAVEVLRKTGFGKNMYHVSEHALIMFLHGRALEGLPARLHYAFPTDQALTAEAEPYWFDAAGERRAVRAELAALPGHRLVEVDFTGIGDIEAPPYPPPADTTAPITRAVMSPEPTPSGWHRGDVTVTLSSTDTGVGVKEIRYVVEDLSGDTAPVAVIEPGASATVPPLTGEGTRRVTYWAVDRLGNAEDAQVLEVRIDRTSPTHAGLPDQPCTIWPPNGGMVEIARVSGADTLSGVADVDITVTADEAVQSGDIRVDDRTVHVRAARDGRGDGRTYVVSAHVVDRAGNSTSADANCSVPHDHRRPLDQRRWFDHQVAASQEETP